VGLPRKGPRDDQIASTRAHPDSARIREFRRRKFGEPGHTPIIETAATDRFSVLVAVVLRNAPLKILVDTASTAPPPRIDSITVSFVASGNKNNGA
jgi:hypothetical protein